MTELRLPERFRPSVADAVVAILAGAAGVIGSYALAGFTPSFVAGPIAGLLARTMPGAVVTFAIVVLGDLGEALNLVTAIGLAVAALSAAALLGGLLARRVDLPFADAALVTALGWLVGTAITAAPVASIGAGVGAGTVVALAGLTDLAGRPPGAGAEFSDERRRLLRGLAGAVTIGLVGAVVTRTRGALPGVGPSTAGAAGTDLPGVNDVEAAEIDRLLDDAGRKSLDVENIEPLVSEAFYEVDINATDPTLSAEDWTLSVTGEVEEEVTLTYDDLTAMPTEHRFVTLRCVGESLNGYKMDNALWTGVPVAGLIERAGPRSDCECVMLRAADGYFEEFPLAALRRGFLAYGMNGEPLPRGHGHPVRALIPGHWGEINVKWLTEIEFLQREADGYWEKRGWHGTGPVNTVAKLHAKNSLPDGRMQVGGHAYAGTRGIDRVEVSVDGGDWREATLSDRLPGEDVWRQWKLEYRPPDRAHSVVVRAVEADGTVQPRERAQAFPSGPTGWVTERVYP